MKELEINYKIGNSNDTIKRSVTLSANNPFTVIITSALIKLKTLPNCLGIRLNREGFEWNFKQGNISYKEYYLLLACLYCGYDGEKSDKCISNADFEVNEENSGYIYEFDGLIIDQTEYSFLTYKGSKLK